jgi:hypothetical protein
MPVRLTPDLHIFRPPLFANLLPFPVEFHDSRIRLNIRADLRLTKKRYPRAPGGAMQAKDIHPQNQHLNPARTFNDLSKHLC